MANQEVEQEVSVNEASGNGGSVLGAVASFVGSVIEAGAATVGKMWDAVMADGMLEAAGRQGIDELGTALKAFPDAIQVAETGSIWNPTPGEVMNSRDLERPMWPSEIAEQNRNQPVQDHSSGHEHDAGYSM